MPQLCAHVWVLQSFFRFVISFCMALSKMYYSRFQHFEKSKLLNGHFKDFHDHNTNQKEAKRNYKMASANRIRKLDIFYKYELKTFSVSNVNGSTDGWSMAEWTELACPSIVIQRCPKSLSSEFLYVREKFRPFGCCSDIQEDSRGPQSDSLSSSSVSRTRLNHIWPIWRKHTIS